MDDLRGSAPIEFDQSHVELLGESLAKILWRGRQWAVTDFGIECLNGTYQIQASKLFSEIDSEGAWPSHVTQKTC